MSEKLHYFLFSYTFPNGNGSIWFGFTKKNITITQLSHAREKASQSLPLGVKVAIIGVSYLGYMTKEEFLDEAAE